MENHYSSLCDLISDYKNFDCSYIVFLDEYKFLDNYLKTFFGDNFDYNCFIKINRCSYVYGKYILKFSLWNMPEFVPDFDEIIKSYCRFNIMFKSGNRLLRLGVEIQDYINFDRECTVDELELLYFRLLKKGYEWIDVNISNAVKVGSKLLILDKDYIYKIGSVNYINQSRLSKVFHDKYFSTLFR